jgi:hypothetical protein
MARPPYPRAPNPVTRHDVRGPVRFPVALRLERRYAERTPWEAFVHQPGPARPIPTTQQERARLQKDVEPILLADGALQKLQQQVRTKLDRGMAWLEAAIHQNVPFRGLVFDSWSLAEALGSMARYRPKDWSSLLTKNRHLDPHSFVLQEAAGPRIPLVGPPMAVEALGPLMPRTASRAVTVQDKTSWPFTLAVRLPGLGKVRLVVSCKRAALTGP